VRKIREERKDIAERRLKINLRGNDSLKIIIREKKQQTPTTTCPGCPSSCSSFFFSQFFSIRRAAGWV
jgi:hypothetical protein